MSEFNPLRTLSVKEFCAEKKIAGIGLYRSKEDTLYAAEANAPHKGSICFLANKITSARDITSPVVSEFAQEDGEGTYFVLHNQGKEAELVLS